MAYYVTTSVRRLKEVFGRNFNANLVVVDASDKFLGELAGSDTDPETKRKIIGRVFIEVFEAEAAKRTDAKWLAQGTLYPDVIESVSPTGGPSVTIQESSQCGRLLDLPNGSWVGLSFAGTLQGRSPRAWEVLGLPDEVIMRHPRPGLAVRCPGSALLSDWLHFEQPIISLWTNCFEAVGTANVGRL